MASVHEVQPAPSLELRRNALQAVLTSAIFSKNPRLSTLLEYLCVRCFRGDSDSIKEYNIATDVFARPSNFDQSTDAIVRVEVHRLRKKLKEFYGGEGADQPIEIIIQSGHYLPEFVFRIRPDEDALTIGNSTPDTALAPSQVWIEQSDQSGKHARNVSALWVWLVVASAAFVLLLVVFVFSIVTIARKSAAITSSPLAGTAATPPVAAVPSGEAVRILCGASGSGYRDREGNQWGADAFYSGGTAVELSRTPIYRTRNPYLFRSVRSGEFSYKIPLKPGVYELRLYFADTSYSPGPAMDGGENVRVFTMYMNGEPALRDFDIVADAGPNTADVKVFKDVHPGGDGYLHLSFANTNDTPLLNAIDIEPGTPRRLRPIRIVTQDNTFTDRSGLTWSADDYFLGGRTIARFGTVSGPDDPQLYERERYGNFSYAIPVAQGHYTVTLHFAETYFGPNGGGGGGPGSRVFDVYCNGLALLRKFDMLREARSHSQVIKTFRGLEANAQGKLLLSFVPIVNYANVSAIEVSDESE